MSDHLLRDMADPYYLEKQKLLEQIRMEARWRDATEIYLPMRLLPHFGEIQWENPGTVNRVYCPGCGKDTNTVGRLWIWNGGVWHRDQGTMWKFCPDCFYVFSKTQTIRVT